MALHESTGVASIHIPARSDGIAVAHVGGIETEAGDDGKRVSVPRVNGYPVAATASAVMTKVTRGQGCIQQSGVVQGKRNRTGTIVTVIVEGTVTAAPDVWFLSQRIYGPDCIFDVVRRF